MENGAFREDLYYRLSVYPIHLPPLRLRLEDIPRLVWFFIHRRQRTMHRRIDVIPPGVMATLQDYDWPGNIRELENTVERAMIRSTGDCLELDGGPLGRLRRAPAAADDGSLDAVERRYIGDVLRQCDWRINGVGNAAERLRLHPSTLRFRLRKLGIRRPG